MREADEFRSAIRKASPAGEPQFVFTCEVVLRASFEDDSVDRGMEAFREQGSFRVIGAEELPARDKRRL